MPSITKTNLLVNSKKTERYNFATPPILNECIKDIARRTLQKSTTGNFLHTIEKVLQVQRECFPYLLPAHPTAPPFILKQSSYGFKCWIEILYEVVSVCRTRIMALNLLKKKKYHIAWKTFWGAFGLVQVFSFLTSSPPWSVITTNFMQQYTSSP